MLPLFAYLPALLVFACIVLAAGPAAGFAIDGNLDNGTPIDRSDDLWDAARWSDLPGSYVVDGVRGLGGGLEYSISMEFCANLLPQFIDAPSCDEIRLAVQQSFDIWTQEHPKLRFEDVSDRVDAKWPPYGVTEPWRGFGAEIDLLVLNPDQVAVVKGFGAWTQFWYSFADPMGTNGRILPGNSMTSADIGFNSTASFYLDPAHAADGSIDFTMLLLHEIGHTFGIDHPDEEKNVNFDNDNDPLNAMLIDCDMPHKGLAPSPVVDLDSVMNPGLPDDQKNRLELSEDELGALKFLYPVCPGTGDDPPAPQPYAL